MDLPAIAGLQIRDQDGAYYEPRAGARPATGRGFRCRDSGCG